MDSGKIMVGIVLLGASFIIGNLVFKDCSKKEKIVAGTLIGAANGAYLGGALATPGGAVAGAAVGAAVGAMVGDRYEEIFKKEKKEK